MERINRLESLSVPNKHIIESIGENKMQNLISVYRNRRNNEKDNFACIWNRTKYTNGKHYTNISRYSANRLFQVIKQYEHEINPEFSRSYSVNHIWIDYDKR